MFKSGVIFGNRHQHNERNLLVYAVVLVPDVYFFTPLGKICPFWVFYSWWIYLVCSQVCMVVAATFVRYLSGYSFEILCIVRHAAKPIPPTSCPVLMIYGDNIGGLILVGVAISCHLAARIPRK